MSLLDVPGGAGSDAPSESEATARTLRTVRARRTRRRLGVVAAVLLCCVGFLLYKGLTSGIEYFKTAKQAVAERATLGNSTFQLEGVVVPRSLRSTSPSSQAFSICSGPTRVAVENSGSPPQLFAPNVAVVLVGHFVGSSDTFSSDQILVKHSNQYVAAHPGRIKKGDGQRC